MDPLDVDISAEQLEALEREIPVLARIKRFADGLVQIPWFANVGVAPSPAVRNLAERYVDGLGFPEAAIAILPTWEDAAAAGETADMASPAWDAEEALRADLTAKALEILPDDALRLALTMVAEQAGGAARDCAAESAALWDAYDEAAERAAVGGVVQGCHGAALALAAGEADPELVLDDHPLVVKYQLFELGRWPVSLIGGSFNIF